MKIARTWIITDTHFGHDKMVEYCGRPKNHSDLILKNLAMIQTGDILIHLGDFCIGNDELWHKLFFEELSGVRKILVKGNHDRKSNNWYLTHGWDFVCDKFSDHFFGNYITFSHIPINGIQNINIHGHFHNTLHRLLDKKFYPGEEERNKEDFPLENYNPKLHRLITIENTNYKPILLEQGLLKI